MSAFPDEPQHFVRWLVDKRIFEENDAAASFASRRDYGSYLGDVLCSQRSKSAAELTIIQDTAREVDPANGLTVVTSTGTRHRADRVVLSAGNLRPCCPTSLEKFSGHPRFVQSPWELDALAGVQEMDSIFIVGTGLTMVDVVLLLRSRRHRGRITARSRRGFLPTAHKKGTPALFALKPEPNEVFDSIIKLLRESGEDWRSTFDGIRPHTVALWQSLSWKDRDRFVKRLRPFWDVFRHRMPESAAEEIQVAQESGQLDAGCGRITGVQAIGDGFEVQMSGGGQTISADWVLNCTGPTMNVKSEKIPILESIVNAGLADYDPLGLGLMVDDAGRTDDSGQVWAIGPLCRGCRWETSAIPEIRVQAHRIATEISN